MVLCTTMLFVSRLWIQGVSWGSFESFGVTSTLLPTINSYESVPLPVVARLFHETNIALPQPTYLEPDTDSGIVFGAGVDAPRKLAAYAIDPEKSAQSSIHHRCNNNLCPHILHSGYLTCTATHERPPCPRAFQLPILFAIRLCSCLRHFTLQLFFTCRDFLTLCEVTLPHSSFSAHIPPLRQALRVLTISDLPTLYRRIVAH